MEKKTFRTFIAGLIAGVLTIIGIRTFSKKYRVVRAELNRLENELDSVEIDIGIAEELNCVATDKIQRIRDTVETERAIIDRARKELADNESQLAECERRITECESIFEKCEKLLHGS